MAPLDEQQGIWKKRGTGKSRRVPKGRQVDDTALSEVQSLLGDQPRRRDLLIEFLHLIQDAYGHLAAKHIAALAHEMRLRVRYRLAQQSVRRGPGQGLVGRRSGLTRRGRAGFRDRRARAKSCVPRGASGLALHDPAGRSTRQGPCHRRGKVRG